MASIHGTFHVTARVQVDPSGKVTDATLEDPGPSKYFAGLTEKAARQWQFSLARIRRSLRPQRMAHSF